MHTVFDALYAQRVEFEGMLLKPNMVIAGKGHASYPVSPETIADATISCFKMNVPAAVPGIVFLSGGQGDEEATANLNAINAKGPQPWKLSFSYGRALQHAALQAWKGADANMTAGQAAFRHRARMNGLATTGAYTADAEKAAS